MPAAAAQLRESQALVDHTRARYYPTLSESASVIRSQCMIGGATVPVSVREPTLTLSASGGFQGTGSHLAKVLSAGNRFWSLGPGLAGTLFDAGLRKDQSAQAVAAYRQTVLGGFQEV